MPSFDVVSEVDMQEVKNAVDQAQREVGNRFDFKGTDPKIELDDKGLTLEGETEAKLKAIIQVVEEKMVKRGVSLKALEYGKIEEASKGRARQRVTFVAGITDTKAKEIGKALKASGLKVQHQIQGDQLRVQGKKRDDLQEAIALMKDRDFGVPLQFTNFRD